MYPAQMFFFCEFCEISNKTFLKELFRRLFLHNTRSDHFSTTALCLFKNDVTHVFRLSNISALFVDWEQDWAQYFKPLAK